MTRRHARRGAAIIYLVVALTAILGVASLAVDYGRVQLVRTQFQQAVEAAARAAAAQLPEGLDPATAAALQWGNANPADVPLDLQSGDVVFGNWVNGAFVAGGSAPDAVRVQVTRSVPLHLASAIQVMDCDVSARATVKIAPKPTGLAGFIGLNSFYVKNNLFVGGYDSSTDATPDESDATDPGMIGSNGELYAKNNEQVTQVFLGPDGTNSLDDTEVIPLEEAIVAPPVDPALYEGQIFFPKSISGTQTLPGGTYYWSSLSLANNATLTFSGPATLFIDGDVTFSQIGTIRAYESRPGNLLICQIGDHKFDGSKSNNMTIVANVYAPTCTFESNNTLTFYGQAVFKSFTARNNASLFYDSTLPGSGAGLGFSTGVMITLVE